MKALEQKDPARFKEAMAIAAKLKQLTAEQVRIGHIYLAVTKDMKPEEVKAKEETAKKLKKNWTAAKNFPPQLRNTLRTKRPWPAAGT